MIIGVCTFELNIPSSLSLKDKRQIIKSVIQRLRNEFNVAVSEIDHLDSRQSAVIAAVTVSNDRNYAHGLLTRVVGWIETTRLDCELVDYTIEFVV